MLIIRPCRASDLADLLHISHVVGKGMTSMPADQQAWQDKITASASAFNSANSIAPVSTYFMVLEDTRTGHLAGTTAIYTGVGLQRPFYSYKISTLVNSCADLELIRQTRVLSLVNDYTGATEIGSLYLLPEYRLPGVGRFLSRARFLLMADYPERFGEQVMAELRGWQDQQGRSPLWEALGKPFFGIEFQDAVNMAALKGSQFISDLMPKYPIYIDLLPTQAQQVIGKPHTSSAPALHMLEQEGFHYNGYVDLFDGGPSVHAHTQQILGVKFSQTAPYHTVHQIDPACPLYLISNGDLDNYQVALAPALQDSDGSFTISAATQQRLMTDHNKPLRFLPLKHTLSTAQPNAA